MRKLAVAAISLVNGWQGVVFAARALGSCVSRGIIVRLGVARSGNASDVGAVPRVVNAEDS